MKLRMNGPRMMITVAAMMRTAGASILTAASPAMVSARCVRLMHEVGLRAEQDGQRRAQLLTLNNRADDAGDLIVGEAMPERLQRGEPALAHVHLGEHASELDADGVIAEFVAGFAQGIEEGGAGFHEQREQVEQVRQPELDAEQPVLGLPSQPAAHQPGGDDAEDGAEHDARRSHEADAAVEDEHRPDEGLHFDLGEPLFGGPVAGMSGGEDLAVDLGQLVAKGAAVECGERPHHRLKGAIQEADAAQLIDAADVVTPFIVLREVLGGERAGNHPDDGEHGCSQQQAGGDGEEGGGHAGEVGRRRDGETERRRD